MYSGLQLKTLYREMYLITIFALYTGKCIQDYNLKAYIGKCFLLQFLPYIQGNVFWITSFALYLGKCVQDYNFCPIQGNVFTITIFALYREMYSITIFALYTGKCILDYIFHPIYREMCSGLQLLLHAKHCRGVAPPPTALVFSFPNRRDYSRSLHGRT